MKRRLAVYEPHLGFTNPGSACACRESAHFKDTRNAINALVAADFVAAHEYAAVFEDHRKVFDFVCAWSFEQYTSKKR